MSQCFWVIMNLLLGICTQVECCLATGMMTFSNKEVSTLISADEKLYQACTLTKHTFPLQLCHSLQVVVESTHFKFNKLQKFTMYTWIKIIGPSN